MILNEAGKICDEELHIMLQKRPSVDLHEYVIMPNHVHVLLYVSETNNNICREEACPLPNIPLTQNLPSIPPHGETIITYQTL
ncbi:hypothetical protein FACS189428_5460 [Clostridia bacterium]|nr:hypothetical protein FACS189428_5460 [Clostridia bacterium]